ncbi:MAG: hypothetical protein ACI3YC_06675 [Alloprevotella sp.]
MKKILTLLFLGVLFACPVLQAQTYTVFSLRGDVKIVKGKSSSGVKLRAELTPETVLSVPTAGRIILLDQAGSKLYTISRPCQGSIKDLIAHDGQVQVKSLSKQYLSYIIRQMSGKGVIETRTCYMDRTASVYRGEEEDSAAVDTTVIIENGTAN